MKANQEDLRAFGNKRTLFISNPTDGDLFVVGPQIKLEGFKIPRTAEGHEFSTAEELATRLDFSCYDDGFELILI